MNFEQRDEAGIIAPHTHNTLLVLQQSSHSLKVPESMSTGQAFNYSGDYRYLYVPYQQFRLVRTCQVEGGLDDPITGRFKFEGKRPFSCWKRVVAAVGRYSWYVSATICIHHSYTFALLYQAS